MPDQDLGNTPKKKNKLLDIFFFVLGFLNIIISIPRINNNGVKGTKEGSIVVQESHNGPPRGDDTPSDSQSANEPPFELSFEVGPVKLKLTKINNETFHLAIGYLMIQFMQATKIFMYELIDKKKVKSAITDLGKIEKGLEACLSNPKIEALSNYSRNKLSPNAVQDDPIARFQGRKLFQNCINELIDKILGWLKKYRIDLPEKQILAMEEFIKNIEDMRNLSVDEMNPKNLKRLFDERLADLHRLFKKI